MWTRGRLEPGNANLIAPWNLGIKTTVPRSGRMRGVWPGYGAGLLRGQPYQTLAAGLYRQGECVGGFGYAMDPSDPSTWTRPVRFT